MTPHPSASPSPRRRRKESDCIPTLTPTEGKIDTGTSHKAPPPQLAETHHGGGASDPHPSPSFTAPRRKESDRIPTLFRANPKRGFEQEVGKRATGVSLLKPYNGGTLFSAPPCPFALARNPVPLHVTFCFATPLQASYT